MHRSIGVSTIDLARSMDVPENLGDMQHELSSYRCPSDAGPPINGERPIQSAAGLAAGLATSNYVGVNSSGELRRNGGLPPNDANGIFIINKATKLKDITDGTSKTADLGERTGRCNFRTASSWDAAALFSGFAAFAKRPRLG